MCCDICARKEKTPQTTKYRRFPLACRPAAGTKIPKIRVLGVDVANFSPRKVCFYGCDTGRGNRHVPSPPSVVDESRSSLAGLAARSLSFLFLAFRPTP
eukprot:scaffold117239_cov36-Phaeocystis_antarctica.AAC.1